jgi:ABC-type Fe3+ transport system substrate-binding protein
MKRPVGRIALCCLVFAALSVPARADETALYQAAKKEGTVVWYTTLIVDQAVRPLVAAFEKKYPGVDVQFSRADSIPTALKIIDEARARSPQSDVFDGIETEQAVAKAGLVADYVPSTASQYPDELKDRNGAWIAETIYFLTPGYNTSLVSAKDVPQTLDDLLAPKWKGKLVWSTARTAGGPIFIGAVLRALGEEKGMAYLKKLAAQKIANEDITARAVLDQVIEGEYPIALAIFNHHAALSAAKGAPVDWIRMQPIAALMQVISLTKGAPHPNAGKLLIDFITSQEGQRVLAQADYLPALPSVPAKFPNLKPEAGHFKAMFFPPEEFGEHGDEWDQLYNQMFR